MAGVEQGKRAASYLAVDRYITRPGFFCIGPFFLSFFFFVFCRHGDWDRVWLDGGVCGGASECSERPVWALFLRPDVVSVSAAYRRSSWPHFV